VALRGARWRRYRDTERPVYRLDPETRAGRARHHYARMRAKAVKLIGNAAVTIIEKVVEYVTALVQGGPAALWAKIKEDLSNLRKW